MSDPPVQPELAFVETDALIDELKRRSDALVIYRKWLATRGDGYDRNTDYKGDLRDVVLLADWGMWTLREKSYRDSISVETEE